MNIAVLGAGTYGSYVIDSLQRKYPDAQITLFDVGDKSIRNECEIGYKSTLLNQLYKGLTDGRYFGYGGASDKWGGQLLTYTENDFAHPDGFMKDVTKYDVQYKDEMLAKFKIVNNNPEHHISEDLFTKTGVWLSMLHRNFFKWFRISSRNNVTVKSHCRVVKFNSTDNKHIDSVIYVEDGNQKEESFDYYFLTAGAFESVRILLSSGLTDGEKVFFSDHISQPVFKIKKSTKIGDEDFVFRMKGTSLITKRMIGEVNDVSFYVHPVFNLKFDFFQMIKDILFYHKFKFKEIPQYIWITLKDIPKVFGFAWSVIVLKKMYVMNGEWTLNIDVENPTRNSYVMLSKEKDKYGVSGLDVNYEIGDGALELFKEARNIAMKVLDKNHVTYELLSDEISTRTCEDIYHPYGMMHFESGEDYFNHWDNMLMVTTGCLSRSGGINPTASMLPMVDEFVNNHLQIS